MKRTPEARVSRRIPAAFDQALRRAAAIRGQSVNEVIERVALPAVEETVRNELVELSTALQYGDK